MVLSSFGTEHLTIKGDRLKFTLFSDLFLADSFDNQLEIPKFKIADLNYLSHLSFYSIIGFVDILCRLIVRLKTSIILFNGVPKMEYLCAYNWPNRIVLTSRP